MKISAQNVLKGKVKSITKGSGTGEVVLEVADGVAIVSIVTLGAIADMELKVGQEAFAVFDASNTMIGVPHHKRGED